MTRPRLPQYAMYPYDPHVVGRLLALAQSEEDGAVAILAEDGAVIPVVARATAVRCESDALIALTLKLNELLGPGAPAEHTSLDFCQMPRGSVVPGGLGGGLVTDGIWVHRRYHEWRLADTVTAVVEGTLPALDVALVRRFAVYAAHHVLVAEPRVALPDKFTMLGVTSSRKEAREWATRLNDLFSDQYLYFWQEIRFPE